MRETEKKEAWGPEASVTPGPRRRRIADNAEGVAPDSAGEGVSRTRATPIGPAEIPSPERADTHEGVPGRLADRPPTSTFSRAPQRPAPPPPGRGQTPYTQTLPTDLRLRPRLPFGTVTSGLPQPVSDDHFRFPVRLWGSRGGTSGSPHQGPQPLLL